MKSTMTWLVVIVGLLLVGVSVLAQGSWEARLRVVPEGLGLKVRLLYEGEDRPMGRLLDLQFEIRNVSDELLKIDWDESSLQLPGEQSWRVVRPEALFEASEAMMLVPAGAGKTLRVCSARSAGCDSTWMQRARLNEDFSLTLRLAVSTLEGPRTAKWRWDFDYHEEAVAYEPAPQDRSLSLIVVAAAVVIFAVLLLR
ncbi:MAG: hypothetical protein WBC63_04305 [Candidatus Bipolaricaulia bacterium]